MDADGTVDPGVFARDRAAMERLQKGDRTALNVLVRAYHEKLYRFICRRVRHHQDAEDISQDVWQSVLNHASNFDLDRPVGPWLYGIAHHRAVDRLRKLTRRREVHHSDYPEAGVCDEDLERDCVEAIKKTLKPRLRAVAWLFLIRDFSPSEIARKIKRPLGTVYRHVGEIREQLRDDLGRL